MPTPAWDRLPNRGQDWPHLPARLPGTDKNATASRPDTDGSRVPEAVVLAVTRL